MDVRTVILSVTVITVGCGPAHWDEHRAVENDEVIYRVVLNSALQRGFRTSTGEVESLVAIARQTIPLRPDTFKELEHGPNGADSLWPAPDPLFAGTLSTTMRRRLASSLHERNRERHWVDVNKTDKVVWVTLVARNDLQGPHEFHRDEEWDFSRPGYAGRYAIVYTVRHDASEGWIVLLRLDGNQWRVVDYRVLWMA